MHLITFTGSQSKCSNKCFMRPTRVLFPIDADELYGEDPSMENEQIHLKYLL